MEYQGGEVADVVVLTCAYNMQIHSFTKMTPPSLVLSSTLTGSAKPAARRLTSEFKEVYLDVEYRNTLISTATDLFQLVDENFKEL